MTNKKKTTHIIQQHTLDIQLDSEEGALDFQEWLATTARQKLPVILERVLDQHAIEGAIIQLDKLTIDLGNIQRSHFQQEFLPKLEQALHRLLTQKINELRLPFKTATVSGSIISQQQQRIQLLETYLTNGNLPWSQTENTPFPLDQVILELLQHQPKRLKAFLEKKHIRQRLQYQLSPQTIQKIVHQFPEDQALLHASSKAMESQPFTHSKTSEIGNLEVNIETPLQIIQQYLKTGEIPEGIDINRLFIQVVEGQPKALLTLDTLPNAGQYLTTHTLDTALQLLQPNFSGYIHQWLQLFQSQYTLTNFQLWQPIWTYLQQHTNVEVAQLTQYYLETITAYTEQTSTQIQQELLQYTRQTEDQYFTIQILLENIQPINNPKNKTQKQITDNQSPTTNHQSLITNHQSRTTKKQSLYLQNAGLVLLWPMFTHFFKTLELTADKQFKDAAAQHRAIHMIENRLDRMEDDVRLLKRTAEFPAQDT